MSDQNPVNTHTHTEDDISNISSKSVLSRIFHMGYTRKQADDIYQWAISDEFQTECEKRGKNITANNAFERVALYLNMYDYAPEEQAGASKSASFYAGNVFPVLLFMVTLLVSLWYIFYVF